MESSYAVSLLSAIGSSRAMKRIVTLGCMAGRADRSECLIRAWWVGAVAFEILMRTENECAPRTLRAGHQSKISNMANSKKRDRKKFCAPVNQEGVQSLITSGTNGKNARY